jgi:hypothetical protein
MSTLHGKDSIGTHPADEDEALGVSIGIAIGQRRSLKGICVLEQRLRGPRYETQPATLPGGETGGSDGVARPLITIVTLLRPVNSHSV